MHNHLFINYYVDIRLFFFFFTFIYIRYLNMLLNCCWSSCPNIIGNFIVLLIMQTKIIVFVVC